MGTSGNRDGYKVFSFNTTIRNPKRNDDFLRTFVKYDGRLMDTQALYEYLCDCVKGGIYKFKVVSSSIKKKWENDEPLTKPEIVKLINDNPQAPGLRGRVMTQLRALKDLGFLIFEPVSARNNRIRISALGWDLLNGVKSPDDVYAQVMIGVQAQNPSRVSNWNESRPFLNTLFVIEELRKLTAAKGSLSKGLHPHEFSVFVLSMKDCDYKKAARDIILYRNRFGHEYNEKYCREYLTNNEIMPLAKTSLLRDYPDDVFRKFEMTGLIIKRGAYKYIYYDFSSYNYGKIQTILTQYKDYAWNNYETIQDYYKSIEDIVLPWERDNTIHKHIVEMKAKVVNHPYDSSLSVEQNEELLDRIFFTAALKKAISNTELTTICKELLILSGSVREKSRYEDISESLRLEYLLALLLGKKYGTEGLISNILYNEDGLPLHCAPSGKCDIVYISPDGAYILEPTMLTSREQQANSETTNVARHAREEEDKMKVGYRVMMIAPRIHYDVADYFSYKTEREKVKMLTLTIERTVELFMESETILRLNDNFDTILRDLLSIGHIKFVDKVNTFRYSTVNT